jgi:putative ABC transport system ATP-binding protein
MSPAQRDRFRADHIGYIFQQFNLLPYLSVLRNVLLPCRLSRRRAARARATAGEVPGAQDLLARLGIGPALWDRPAAALSVGQQQRVAAARALIGRPELVIADEPTSALDAGRRDDFMSLLLGACAQAGGTLVFVSHDDRLAGHFGRSIELDALGRAAAGGAK